MFLLLLTAPVLAVPVSGDLQVRLFPSAVEFAEELAESMDTSIAYDTLEYGKYDCYELLQITDFNLEIPIDDVEIAYGQDILTLEVSFGQIHGEKIGLYGESGWWDTCLDFDKTIEYIILDKGHFSLPLQAVRDEEGRLSFTWSEAPLVTGELDTDISWFPDSVVLYFFEDLIFEYIGNYVAEVVPPMLEEYMGQSLLDGDYDGLLVEMVVGELELTDEVFALSIDSELGFEGEAACDLGDLGESVGGGAPELDFDDDDDAHMAIGLTEAFINNSRGTVSAISD